MKQRKKFKYKKQTFILLAFLIVIGIIVMFSNSYKGTYYGTKKIDQKVISLIEENKSETLLHNILFDNKVVNVFFEQTNKSYKSYILDYKTGEEINFEDLIKKDQLEKYNEKINELLDLKYPSFIAQCLKTTNGKKIYEMKNNEVIIHYTDYTIHPVPTEALNLIVNYKEIKDYIDFKVDINEEYENENGYHYDSTKKTVALSFDDGPNGEKTLKLLDILNQNKMHATFFMVGNRMAGSPNTVKKVIESGNEIGSHSYNHANLTRMTIPSMVEQEKNTDIIYKSITGKDLTLMRPPYGSVNSDVKKSLNYAFVNWSIDTEDWKYRNVDHIFNTVMEKVQDGDIILMHDLYDTTIDAVEKLLPEMYVLGYQVVTVSELANLKGKNLENHNLYRYFRN